jgi:hypothetical protein
MLHAELVFLQCFEKEVSYLTPEPERISAVKNNIHKIWIRWKAKNICLESLCSETAFILNARGLPESDAIIPLPSPPKHGLEP